MNPKLPVTMKAICQLDCTRTQITRGGANKAPSDVPALKKPTATERSLAGNHSEIALIPAGIAAASVNPSNPRKAAREPQPPAKACNTLDKDQAIANNVNPDLMPRKSSTKPHTDCITV